MLEWLLAKLCGESIPSDEMISWLFNTYRWLIKHEGGFETYKQNRRLIAFTPENFPIKRNGGEFLAYEVFNMIRVHALMADWPCRLVAQQRDTIGENMAPFLQGDRSGAAGTFRMDYDEAIITYSPDLLEDIPSFINVMAHELSHYYLSNVASNPPGGSDAEEYATDVTVVFLGFGVFKSNCVYRSEYTYKGERHSRRGYLGEMPSAYAFAIFSELLRLNHDEVAALLKPNPCSYYRSAVRDIKKRWTLRIKELEFT